MAKLQGRLFCPPARQPPPPLPPTMRCASTECSHLVSFAFQNNSTHSSRKNRCPIFWSGRFSTRPCRPTSPRSWAVTRTCRAGSSSSATSRWVLRSVRPSPTAMLTIYTHTDGVNTDAKRTILFSSVPKTTIFPTIKTDDALDATCHDQKRKKT